MKTEPIKAGDVVLYRDPVDALEADLTFTVLELRGDRVLLESRDFRHYRIAPTEVVALTDVVILND